MNSLARALRYTLRKWKRSLLLLGLLTAVTALVLSGLAIRTAQAEQAAALRGTTGASFTVERDLSSGKMVSDENGTYVDSESISQEMVDALAALDGVEGYDAATIALASLTKKEDGTPLHDWPPTSTFYLYASQSSEYNPLFLTGQFKMVEGDPITKDTKNGVVLSKNVMDDKDLKIGDTVTGINNPDNDDPYVDMTIVGVYEIIDDTEKEFNAYDDSSYFDKEVYGFCSPDVEKALNINYAEDIDGFEDATFYVADAARLDAVMDEAKNMDSINWDHFTLSANNEIYENIAGSLGDQTTLVTLLILLITLVSTLLVALILALSLRSRRREAGILLAFGLGRGTIVWQQWLEVALVAVCAFPLGYAASLGLASPLAALAGDAGAAVTLQQFALVAGVGGALLTLVVLVLGLTLTRLTPRAILSHME